LFFRPFKFFVILIAGLVAADALPTSVAHQSGSDTAQAKPQPSPQGSASQASSTTKKSSAATKSSKSSASKSLASKSMAKSKKTSTRKHRRSPRVQRMHAAFVASADLKPMAQQLLQDRTPAAYAGVEAYAQKHAKDDAGSLAWLVVGYARWLDHDYPRTIEALNRAKLHAGDLGDYVAFYLGNAYLQSGHTAEAVATLTPFSKNYPDSLLARDADVTYAASLTAENHPDQAVTILERQREPLRADVELALARAYSATNQAAKASAAFRNLYYNLPTSPEADLAAAELKKMAGAGRIPGSVTERRTRADLLAKGKRWSDAADTYRDLLDEVSSGERVSVQLALASALERGNRYREAKPVLNAIPDSTPAVAAQKQFLLGEAARAANDDTAFFAAQNELRQSAPTSTWFEQSLLSSGNMYLLRRDFDHAIDSYRELQERFPNGSRAAYAHWKVAWLSLRQSRLEEAKKGFEQQIGLYPSSAEVPNALYWRARLAEEDGEIAKARAFYQKLSDRYRNYYYAELARQRMKTLKATGDPVSYALLDRVPALRSAPKLEIEPVPMDDLRVQKAHLLENGALLDFAVRELQADASSEGGGWVPNEIARLCTDSGRYDRAIQVMKRTVPSYFAVDIPELPRPYWEALFPKAYWPDLKRFSDQNNLDPYLVASLIRQESEFNPNAISHANAVGLMQLLPSTGKHVAKELKIRHFNPSELYTPTVNLQLGTRYFRTMVDKFGAFEYALAAYNAGSDRVEDWLSQGKYRDIPEFVESIPFTETREYVQAIVRNSHVYRQLYGADQQAKSTAQAASTAQD